MASVPGIFIPVKIKLEKTDFTDLKTGNLVSRRIRLVNQTKGTNLPAFDVKTNAQHYGPYSPIFFPLRIKREKQSSQS